MPRPSELELHGTIATAAGSVPNGGILIPTDGTPDADGAVRVGLALARRDGIPVEILSVLEPMPLYDTDAVAIPDVDQLMRVARESLQAALDAQRDRTDPRAHYWPSAIEVGGRVSAIAAAAQRTGASVIVIGLGAHGAAARLFLRETALRVIRTARTPVLAVPATAWGVPHSALVAIDFTTSSEHAARAALDLLGGEGTLYLAHVGMRLPIPHGDPRTWEDAMEGAEGVVPRLEAVARRLAVPPGVRVEYVSLRGEPSHEMLAFVEERQIDLIAAGAHGRTPIGRLVLGSVSTKLVRTARCWVLVAPPCPDEAPASEPDPWT